MAANMIAALFKEPSSPPRREDWKQSRDAFSKQLNGDAKAVVSTMLETLNKDFGQVVDEIVSQTNEFWANQVHKMEELHKMEVQQLQSDLADVNKQLDETVVMYNQVVQSLNTQLAEAHEVADAAKRVAESKAAVAQQHTASTDSVELARQLAAAQAAAQTAEQKSQQRRLILVQTVEKQHREIEDLQKQLLKAQARDQQLTKVSEHLLQKQAALVAEVKSLKGQLAEIRGEPAGSAESSGGGATSGRKTPDAYLPPPEYKPPASPASNTSSKTRAVVDEVNRLPTPRSRSSSGSGAAAVALGGGSGSSKIPSPGVTSPTGAARPSSGMGIGSRRLQLPATSSSSPRTSNGGS